MIRSFFLFILLSTFFYQSLPAQPNFVIILADDMGWNGTSSPMIAADPASQSDFYFTPNLQALASAGMTFSQAYASAPKCAPTRCSLLTGKSTARNQFTNTDNMVESGKLLLEADTRLALLDGDITIGEWLQTSGLNYTTAHFGKWHLRADGTAAHGFDEGDGQTSNSDGDNEGGIAQNDPKKIFELTNKAISFMQQATSGNRPFYVQLSHYAVHGGLEAQQATIDLYNDPTARPPGSLHDNVEYAAMTEDLDTSIGLLLDEIDRLGIDNNSYIIFLSDNGGQMNFTDNTPLRRGKTFIYEGGIRVPMIVKGPGIDPGSYEGEAVVAYDLFPTIAALSGSSQNLPDDLDGVDISPLFQSLSISRDDPIYFHSPHYDNNPNKTPRSAVADGKYKLIVEYETGFMFLYDLSADLEESQDLSTSLPSITHRLCVQLRDHLLTSNANMPSLDPSHPNFNGSGNDVDNDGLDDDWEFSQLLSYTYGPLDDPDNDGVNNMMEMEAGTDPYTNNGPSTFVDQEIEKNPWFNIFPNPATDLLQIQLSDQIHATELDAIAYIVLVVN